MEGSGCHGSKIPSMMVRDRFYADPGRTIMIYSTRTSDKMIRRLGDEFFMTFWHAVLMGFIVFRKQGVEKSMEFASAYETNVANLHMLLRVPWTRLPQCMSVRRIFDGKLFAENIALVHRGSQESRRITQRPWGEVCVPVGVGRHEAVTFQGSVT